MMVWKRWIICSRPVKYAGTEALDMPQLVLLDIKLPKISGLEVLKTNAR